MYTNKIREITGESAKQFFSLIINILENFPFADIGFQNIYMYINLCTLYKLWLGLISGTVGLIRPDIWHRSRYLRIIR